MAEKHIDEILGSGYSDTLFSGTRDPQTGIWYRIKGAGLDFYTNIVRMIWNIIETARIAKMFRLYVDSTDSALQFSMTGGNFWDGATLVTVNPQTNIDLAPSATNLIWLLTDGSINVGVAWPDPAVTKHIRVGEVVAGATSWDITSDWTDRRSESMYGFSGPVAASQTQVLTQSLLVGTWTGASGSSPQNVELTILDSDGNPISKEVRLAVSVHADVDGDDVYNTDATIAIGAKGTEIAQIVENKEIYAKTNISGELTVTVTKPTVGQCYVVARLFRRPVIVDLSDIATIVIS